MKRAGKVVIYLIIVHITALLFLSLFRVVLFHTMVDGQDLESTLVIKSYLMGVRFDNVISCYVLILPLLVLIFSSCFNFEKKWLNKSANIYLSVLYSIVLFSSAVNIPYFQYFFKNLNASIWNWIDEPEFVINMITKNIEYILYFLLFITIVVLFCWILNFLKRTFLDKKTIFQVVTFKSFVTTIGFSLLLASLCLIGIRGRLGLKSPIRIGTAFFCNDPFLNQLALNPTYVLIRTTMDMGKEEKNRINFMDEDDALNNVRTYFHIESADTISGSPIARISDVIHPTTKKNVVIILMESMASHFVADTCLTPFINSLIKKSTYYPNTYSSGIHTMNAVFGTLFSYPALLNQHPFKTGEILTFDSWPVVMKAEGYNTYYFSTHDEQFDNIGGYLSANQISTIIAQKNYPIKEIKSNLGVTDDFMFHFSLPILKDAYNSEKPFFATFLTASNHTPYIIPDYYHPRSSQERYQVIEFADYSLDNFFTLARKESWYQNTIFVLLGDHGAANTIYDYDVSLAYHHIPLIIYDPSDETPHINPTIAGQIDVFPTIMSKLGLPFTNNTFGLDLMSEKRDMIFFSSDDAYCCLDSTFYFVHRNQGSESLYQYKNNNQENIISAHYLHAEKMKEYVQSMMQAAQYMISNKNISIMNQQSDE